MSTENAFVLGAVMACALIAFGAWLVGIERKHRAYKRRERELALDTRPYRLSDLRRVDETKKES